MTGSRRVVMQEVTENSEEAGGEEEVGVRKPGSWIHLKKLIGSVHYIPSNLVAYLSNRFACRSALSTVDAVWRQNEIEQESVDSHPCDPLLQSSLLCVG